LEEALLKASFPSGKERDQGREKKRQNDKSLDGKRGSNKQQRGRDGSIEIFERDEERLGV